MYTEPELACLALAVSPASWERKTPSHLEKEDFFKTNELAWKPF